MLARVQSSQLSRVFGQMLMKADTNGVNWNVYVSGRMGIAWTSRWLKLYLSIQ